MPLYDSPRLESHTPRFKRPRVNSLKHETTPRALLPPTGYSYNVQSRCAIYLPQSDLNVAFSLPGSLAQQHPLQPDKAVGPNQRHPRDTHDGGVCDHSRPSRPQRRRHAFSEGGAGLLHRLTVRSSTQRRGPRIGSTAMALGNRCALPQRRQRLRSGTRQEFGEAVRDRSGRLGRPVTYTPSGA